MPEIGLISSAVIKRAIDVSGALFGLIVCAPLMLLIAIFICLKAGRPILYRESRIGLHQKPFRLCKFRSMKANNSKFEVSVVSVDDARILSFGHFLRGSHLDELPQLYSVLKGDMSLVGPRPYKTLHFESLPQASRQIIASVKPGLTGSDSLMFIAEDEALKGLENPEAIYLKFFLPEKAKQQIQYIQTQSNRADLRLILKTFRVIFFRRSHQNSVCYLRSIYERQSEKRPAKKGSL
tara:strand:+ start:3231 stop:3941 length:711 start_codon:yes stop_codon:yes gene_type:complete